jgi:hypothetical protein
LHTGRSAFAPHDHGVGTHICAVGLSDDNRWCPHVSIAARPTNASSRNSNRRTIWIPFVARLRQYPNLVLVHGPIHASWLNQIEIYFSIVSIVQRRALTPNEFTSLADVEHRVYSARSASTG